MLTPRQSAVLAYLTSYVAEHGYAPTIAEIGAALGMSSLATVHVHLARLERHGLIVRASGHPRGIEIVGACPYCGRGDALRVA